MSGYPSGLSTDTLGAENGSGILMVSEMAALCI